MTRLLLFVITGLATLSLWANGDTSGLWLALTSFIESGIIWMLALKKGIGGQDTLDWICLALCGAGIMFWLAGGNSMAGLIASIVADLVACIPSLHKTARLPH